MTVLLCYKKEDPLSHIRKSVSVNDALALMLKRAPKPRFKMIDLQWAAGRILGEDIVALRDQPPFAASAMDGYAIAYKTDDPEQRLVTLKIIGESLAGKAYGGEVRPGEAVRVFTGAPLPAGTRFVVLQEHTQSAEGRLLILRKGWADPENHMRPQGFDFKSGDLLLKAGTRLDAWRLSLLAASGVSKIKVARKPHIVVLCTGDELVSVGHMPRADQVFESTSIALLTLIENWGGKVQFLGVAKDTVRGLIDAVEELEFDLLVTIGGASVGDYDLVRPALEHLGLELDFEQVSIKPGKPTGFGCLGDNRLVLSLPGNPASAMVCAQIFLKPFIEFMLGQSQSPTTQIIPLATPLPATGDRETYLRAKLTHDDQGLSVVEAFEAQDSSLVTVMAQSSGLIRRPAHSAALDKGQLVEFLSFERM